VHSTLAQQEVAAEELITRVQAMGLEVRPFDDVDASLVGALRPRTRALGLSLADRACLALGLRLGRTVLAADGALREAAVGVEVVLIR
jgi:ribonuclease VapC